MVDNWRSTMCRRRRLPATKSWLRSGAPRSITSILLKPQEPQGRYSRSTCLGFLVMSFQGSSNRLAVTLHHLRQATPCSASLPGWGRMRSMWRSRLRPSQENHPISPLRRRHPCRWRPKQRGRESSPTVTWKRETILIHGGAGAVGAYAVQLASHAGATVIATASGGDEAYLKSIGANRVIDYREEQFRSEEHTSELQSLRHL